MASPLVYGPVAAEPKMCKEASAPPSKTHRCVAP